VGDLGMINDGGYVSEDSLSLRRPTLFLEYSQHRVPAHEGFHPSWCVKMRKNRILQLI
jgi:hypothetical protein